MTQRALHLDIAKGIGILLVVFGHNWLVENDKAKLFHIIFSFHVPLFFFLSGAFLRTESSLSYVAAQRADALLKPYLVTFVLLAIDDVLLESDSSAAMYFGGVVYGGGHTIPWMPLWFLPHLWALSVFAWATCRLTNIDSWQLPSKVLALLGLLVAGVMSMQLFWNVDLTIAGQNWTLLGLPFSLDLLLVSSVYFLAGYLLRKQLLTLTVQPRYVVLALLGFIAVHVATNDTIDLNLRRYDSLFASTIAAACGIYLTLALSSVVARLPLIAKPLAYFGSASLFVLLFHFVFQWKAFYFFQGRMGPGHDSLAATLAFICAVTVSLGIFEAVKRSRFLSALYLPRRPSQAPVPPLEAAPPTPLALTTH